MSNQLFEPDRSEKPTIWKASRAVLITSLVVTAALVGIRQLGALQSLELNGFDQFVRLQPDRGPDNRLLIVGVTEEDIKRRNEYPLTDRTITELLDKLEQNQPQVIGLDIIRDVPQPKGDAAGHAELIKYLQESDRTVVVCKTSDVNSPGFSAPSLLKEQAETQIGAVNFGIDPDGVLRRSLLTITPTKSAQTDNTNVCDHPPNPQNPVIPYFGLLLALPYLAETRGIQSEQTPSGHLQLGKTVFQPLETNSGPYRSAEIGGQQGYQMLIDYRSPNQVAKQVSLTDVLANKVDPKLVKGRIVLIGYTARSVHDEFFTPYGQTTHPPMPGVLAHAQIVSQILSNVLDNRPLFWFLPQWAEALWIFGWAVLGGIVSWQLRRLVYLLPAIVIMLVILSAICWSLFSLAAGWIPLVPPVLAFLLTAAGVVFFSRGYAQAIYQGVKGFLKLDIEIDQTKKEKDVAEITESDFFQQLQSKAEQIKRDKTATATEQTLGAIDAKLFTEDLAKATPPTADAKDLDYLVHLQNRGRGKRRYQHALTVELPEDNQPQQPNEWVDSIGPALSAATVKSGGDASPASTLTDRPLPSPQPSTVNASEFDFLLPQPAPQNPTHLLEASQSARSQLLHEVDEYYQQLKRQREGSDRSPQIKER